MTSKEKAIEAIEKAWEIINDKQPETTEEINVIRFAVNTARQLILKPSLDDAIKVVEEKLQRLRLLKETTREWHYQFNTAYDILTALKGLKGE